MSLLDVRSLTKRFPVRGTGQWLHAVDDVTFAIERGESVGLVGESGCGKTTLVRLITRLLEPSDGRILFDGRDIGALPPARFTHTPDRRRIQMVFQDPLDSLNPRFTAFDTIAEPLRRLGTREERAHVAAQVEEAADLVGLPRTLLGRFPHQLSGGQQQRVGIARAIVLRPALLVLDEPTSALDVSVQAVVLQLLADLRQRLQLSYLFVSHDLNLVRLLTDRVLVMYLGTLVETGPSADVFEAPVHPYTRALVPSTRRRTSAASTAAAPTASSAARGRRPRCAPARTPSAGPPVTSPSRASPRAERAAARAGSVRRPASLPGALVLPASRAPRS